MYPLLVLIVFLLSVGSIQAYPNPTHVPFDKLCSTSKDCTMPNTECQAGTCVCKPHYQEDPGTKQCIPNGLDPDHTDYVHVEVSVYPVASVGLALWAWCLIALAITFLVLILPIIICLAIFGCAAFSVMGCCCVAAADSGRGGGGGGSSRRSGNRKSKRQSRNSRPSSRGSSRR